MLWWHVHRQKYKRKVRSMNLRTPITQRYTNQMRSENWLHIYIKLDRVQKGTTLHRNLRPRRAEASLITGNTFFYRVSFSRINPIISSPVLSFQMLHVWIIPCRVDSYSRNWSRTQNPSVSSLDMARKIHETPPILGWHSRDLFSLASINTSRVPLSPDTLLLWHRCWWS